MKPCNYTILRFCVITSLAFKLLRFSPMATMKTVNRPGYNSLQLHSLDYFKTWAFSVRFFWSARSVHCNTRKSLHTLWRPSFGLMKMVSEEMASVSYSVITIISPRGTPRTRDGSDEHLNEEYCNRDPVAPILGIKNELGKVSFLGIIISFDSRVRLMNQGTP